MLSIHHIFYAVALAAGLSLAKKSEVPNPEPVASAKTIRVEDENHIPWIDNRKLTWSDFQSDPKLNTETVALTSTTLGLTYKLVNGELDYQISCNFTKHKSWATMKTDYILAHEQGHFDITELFARRLYQSLRLYQFSSKTYKQDIANIYQQAVKEKEDLQQAYDRETNHSRNRKVQAQWEERITDMLTASEPFADYP